jgi:hypothetical protein
MQIQRNPAASCQRASLPFDDGMPAAGASALVAKKEPRR